MNYLYTAALIIMASMSNLSVVAQTKKPTHILRVQEDNDVLNLIGERTDRSYTNGTRIDYFQLSRIPRNSFLYRILPTAGDSSVLMDGWGLAQYMVTPNDITKTENQPDDYPYAGSLTVTRSFLSFNPVKKFSYQSELLIGIRGKHAFAKQTQTALHAMINSPKPLGWHNQLEDQLLINLTFTAEKNLLSWHNVLELSGGIQGRVGSLMDAVLIYPMVRIGKMSPYFDGILSTNGSNRRHVSNKMQYYLVFKPIAAFVAYNAMLKGKRENYVEESNVGPTNSISRYVSEVQFGFVIAYKNLSVSYLQSRTSSYDKGLYDHNFGTLELCVKW